MSATRVGLQLMWSRLILKSVQEFFRNKNVDFPFFWGSANNTPTTNHQHIFQYIFQY